MKRLHQIYLFTCVGIAGITVHSKADHYCQKLDNYATTFVPRSIADNLVKSNHFYFLTIDDCSDMNAFLPNNINIGYEFKRSFNGKRIAEGIFGNHTLTFTGSDRCSNENDILADYFGLATDTKPTTLSFAPRIQSHIVNFNAHINIFCGLQGPYVHINIPFAETEWKLHPRHHASLSSTPFMAGYMDDVFNGTSNLTASNVRTPAPLTSFKDALSGKGFGAVAPWKNGKFFGNKKKRSGITGVNIDLGYNLVDCPTSGIGVYAHVAAPGTHKKNRAKFVFTPTISDTQWKVGAGITAHAQLYNGCGGEHIFTGMVQGYLSHPLPTTQERLFDFTEKGHLSRYMLLKEFDHNNYANGKVISGVDFSTRSARIHIDVQGEFIAQLRYQHRRGIGAFIGYNMYGKSHEKIHLNESIEKSNVHYGFKGGEEVQMANFVITGSGSNPKSATYTLDGASGVQYLTSTESLATINRMGITDNRQTAWIKTSDTVPSGAIGYADLVNQQPSIGRAQYPFPVQNQPLIANKNGCVFTTVFSATDAPTYNTSTNQFEFTPAPVYVTDDMIDASSAAAPHQVTHKFFGAIDYTGDCSCIQPYLKIGAEVEFAAYHEKQSLNQWGVSVTGGIEF